jgi:serine/threonine protein kinase
VLDDTTRRRGLLSTAVLPWLAAMPAAPSLPVPVGELVAGKYRIERVLGHGGMGVVVAAMHEQLRQRVAIKMLLPEAKASPNAVSRFLREARAAAAIKGEHVARVLDVGELEGGSPYIVMEHLEGRDLAAILAALPEPRRLPAEEAVGYVLQACEAIAEAHAAGIVHRDLKPSNLFLSRRPDGTPMVKVLDFGISKALLSPGGEGTLTTTSSFVGSPIYAPPEQLVAAHEVDARADIWALGTILYEGMAGRPPYVGDSVMHVASRIFNEPPTPLGQLRPDLPVELVAVVMRCLEKKPEDRFQDVSGLAEGLAPFAPAASISAERVARIVAASTPVSGPSPLRGSQSGASASVAVTARPAAARVWIVGGVALAGVAIGFILFSGRTPGAPASTASLSQVGNPPVPPPPAIAVPAATASAASSAALDPGDAAASAPQLPAGTPSQRPTSAPPHKNPLSVGVK